MLKDGNVLMIRSATRSNREVCSSFICLYVISSTPAHQFHSLCWSAFRNMGSHSKEMPSSPICPYCLRCPIYTSSTTMFGPYISKPFFSILCLNHSNSIINVVQTNVYICTSCHRQSPAVIYWPPQFPAWFLGLFEEWLQPGCGCTFSHWDFPHSRWILHYVYVWSQVIEWCTIGDFNNQFGFNSGLFQQHPDPKDALKKQ